jgi:hypothetical protein
MRSLPHWIWHKLKWAIYTNTTKVIHIYKVIAYLNLFRRSCTCSPTHEQLQGKRRSDRETPIDLIAYLRGCKLIFACAIKWLAPGEGVSRLLGELGLHLDFAVSLRSLKVMASLCVDLRPSIHG